MDYSPQLSQNLCLYSQNEHFAQDKFDQFNDSPSLPVNCWNKIHSVVSRFIWNRKRPRLKLSTTQRGVASVGLSVPIFKFYFWSFVCRPLLVWCDTDALVSWCKLEENCARPWNLQEVLFAKISSKQCWLRVIHLHRSLTTMAY